MSMTLKPLPQVDTELIRKIENYSDHFWTSADRNPREGLHSYFQYPAMMVPGLLREITEVVHSLQPEIENIFDPFVGAGTTMTSCMLSGLNFSGQDINPLAVLVSRAKIGPFYHLSLPRRIDRLFEKIDDDKNKEIEADFFNIDKWFQSSVQVEISKIRRAIRQENQLWARRFFWVAIAETVRVTSNSRTSTFKLHIRPDNEIRSREISAIEIFKGVVIRNYRDFLAFRDSLVKTQTLCRGHYTGKLAIHLQDSTDSVIPPSNKTQLYDLLITSPPYGDNRSTVPYGQHSYLPLQWIDIADIDKKAVKENWLRTTYEIDRRSLGGKIPRQLDTFEMHLLEKSSSYKTAIDLLRGKPKDRKSRITTFMFDLDKALDPIVNSLRENAYLIWIIGNRHVGGIEIPTDHILTELLERRGVKHITRISRRMVFRRMATRNKIASMMRKEHILVYRKV